MARDDEQTNIRLPVPLKRGLEATAEVNRRSFTAEVVDRLQKSLEGSGNVYLPEGIIEMLRDAAEKKGRSVDSELYARIIETFAEKPDETRLRAMLEDARQDAAQLKRQLLELEGKQQRAGDTLYILLDSSGYPISWAEINAYLAELKLASNKAPTDWHATIITPDMESSSRRATEAVKLANALRAVGRSQVITATHPQLARKRTKK